VIAYKRSVLILDGKIVSIKDVIRADPKNSVVVIDGGGAYMIPGLFDMHMHFYHDQGLDKKYLNEEVKLPLVNGVITVRIMNGMPEYLELKKNISMGKIPGPEMFVASPQLVGNGHSGSTGRQDSNRAKRERGPSGIQSQRV
jgi:imidazolonepropionase-like amidohydrolase